MKRTISAIIACLFLLSAMTLTGASAAVSKTYYLFGYINQSNYACEEDYQNMGEYRFDESGKLRVKFDAVSYVAVKEDNNTNWFMTDGWQGEVNSVTLLNTSITGENSDKLKIPAGEWIILTLSENPDNTLTLSYSLNDETYYPIRTRLWDYVNMDVKSYILAPGNYWADETLQPFLKALDKANAALDNPDSTDEQLREAYNELTKAAENLKKEDAEYWSHKLSELEKECAKDFERQFDDEYYYRLYTKESYDQYREIYQLALGTLTFDEKEIKSLYHALYAARENLVRIGEAETAEPTEPTTVTQPETVKLNTEPNTEQEETMPENVDDTSIEYWARLKRELELECAKDFEQEESYYYRFYTAESYNKYRSAYRLSLGTLSTNISEIKSVYNNLLTAKNQLVKIEAEPTEANTAVETETVKANTEPTETNQQPTVPATEKETESYTETEAQPTESETEQAFQTLPETEPNTQPTSTAEPTASVQPPTAPAIVIKSAEAKAKSNPLKVTTNKKTVKAKKLKKGKLTVKALTIKNAAGELSFKKLGGSKKLGVTKTGKITIKKGTKKGTYVIKIKITAKGNSRYKPKTIRKTVTIKVR